MDPTAVTVVVCAYTLDRLVMTIECVRAAAGQTRPPTEIIVVVDHAPVLADRLRAASLPARVIESDGPPGLSSARNVGIKSSTTTLVAFIDDDAVPAPTWLEGLVVAMDRPGVAVVGGHAEPAWEGGAQPGWFPPEFLWVIGCSYVGQVRDGPARNPLGCSMLFRRSVFEAVGGFDPSIGRLGTIPLGCEETELCIRMSRRDPAARVWLTDASVVAHHVPRARQTLRYFFRRCFYEGVSKAVIRRLAGSGATGPEVRYAVRFAAGRHRTLPGPRHPRSASAGCSRPGPDDPSRTRHDGRRIPVRNRRRTWRAAARERIAGDPRVNAASPIADSVGGWLADWSDSSRQRTARILAVLGTVLSLIGLLMSRLVLDDLGLAGGLAAPYWAGLVLLPSAAIVEASRGSSASRRLLAVLVVAWLLLVWLTPLALEGTPRFRTSFSNYGYVDPLVRGDGLDRAQFLYHNWPLFPIAMAVVRLVGIGAELLLAVFPVIVMCLYLGLMGYLLQQFERPSPAETEARHAIEGDEPTWRGMPVASTAAGALPATRLRLDRSGLFQPPGVGLRLLPGLRGGPGRSRWHSRSPSVVEADDRAGPDRSPRSSPRTC